MIECSSWQDTTIVFIVCPWVNKVREKVKICLKIILTIFYIQFLPEGTVKATNDQKTTQGLPLEVTIYTCVCAGVASTQLCISVHSVLKIIIRKVSSF